MAVFVYAPGADNFDTLGLCGPLIPTGCDFNEKRNGLSQLTLKHPIDDEARWSQLVPGCVLKAEVPVRTTPEIDGTTLVTTVETWLIKTIATAWQRRLYSKASGGRVLKTLPVWADKARTQRFPVTVVKKGENRYKVKTRYGTGWVATGGIEYAVTETIPNDPAAIERVEAPWTVKPQLFRIRTAEVTEKGVTATASHIFYDLAGNLTSFSADNPTCAEALSGLMGNCLSPHEFEGFTNLLDQRVGASWTRTGLVEALLAPDTGLVDRWGLELVRDNYEFCLLREAGTNRGVGIEYGKNLLGVTCTTDVSGACARIVPVGKTSKGKDLLLTAGTYDINGTTVVVGPGETWVTSPQAGDYPAPMMTAIDTGVKAKSGKAADLLTARRRMIEAALNQFADTACDQPSLNLRVDFVAMGDTVEYAQYRRLEDVYLCDRVRVRHPGIGLDVLTEVIEVTWDCLTGRYKSIELGRVQLDRLRVKLPHWQLPSGIPGTIILPDTMDGGAIMDGTVTDNLIALGAVTESAIAQGAVTEPAIAQGAVTDGKIAEGAIAARHIASRTITAEQIAVGTITAESGIIDAGAIGTAQIADGSITDAKIVELTANKITSGTIDAADIEVINLKAANITVGTINGQQIAQGAIGTQHIADGAISGSKIEFGAIAASKLNLTQHIIY